MSPIGDIVNSQEGLPMPSRERVEALIAMVEAAKYVEAIEAFYAEGATMQENNAPPRGPRAKLVEVEKKMLAAHAASRTLPGSTYVVDGDSVVIRWVFVFTRKDGTSFRMEELALQRWQGDRIAEERFFYDPAQLKSIS
jgi:ketosteroid isomerase-like protein